MIFFGLFVDVSNYLYTRNRIKLLKNAKPIWDANKLRLSYLGVLYTIVEVDKSIPDNLVDQFVMNKLGIIDTALVTINLDGLLHVEVSKYAENNLTRFMLVKFVPNMPNWTWFNFIISCVIVYVAYKLIIYYGLWDKAAYYVKPILHGITG